MNRSLLLLDLIPEVSIGFLLSLSASSKKSSAWRFVSFSEFFFIACFCALGIIFLFYQNNVAALLYLDLRGRKKGTDFKQFSFYAFGFCSLPFLVNLIDSYFAHQIQLNIQDFVQVTVNLVLPISCAVRVILGVNETYGQLIAQKKIIYWLIQEFGNFGQCMLNVLYPIHATSVGIGPKFTS